MWNIFLLIGGVGAVGAMIVFCYEKESHRSNGGGTLLLSRVN